MSFHDLPTLPNLPYPGEHPPNDISSLLNSPWATVGSGNCWAAMVQGNLLYIKLNIELQGDFDTLVAELPTGMRPATPQKIGGNAGDLNVTLEVSPEGKCVLDPDPGASEVLVEGFIVRGRD